MYCFGKRKNTRKIVLQSDFSMKYPLVTFWLLPPRLSPRHNHSFFFSLAVLFIFCCDHLPGFPTRLQAPGGSRPCPFFSHGDRPRADPLLLVALYPASSSKIHSRFLELEASWSRLCICADVGGAKAVWVPFPFVDMALRSARPISAAFQTVMDKCRVRATHLYLYKM